MTVAVEVWWSSLVAADRALMAGLDRVERDRLAATERPADQGRSLVGFALLRSVVAGHLGVTAADVVIDRTCQDCGKPHGRPRVVGPGDASPWVSVSHSGVLVVVALCATTDVGVDVQRVADLGAAHPDGWAAAERWTRGEAVGKLGPRAAGEPVHVAALQTPAAGYTAALAVVSGEGVDVGVGHWAPTSR